MNFDFESIEQKLNEQQNVAETLVEEEQANETREQHLSDAISKLSNDAKVIEQLLRNKEAISEEQERIKDEKEKCSQRLDSLADALNEYSQGITDEAAFLSELSEMGENVDEGVSILEERKEWLSECQKRLQEISEKLDFALSVELQDAEVECAESTTNDAKQALHSEQNSETIEKKPETPQPAINPNTDEDWKIVSVDNNSNKKFKKVVLQGERTNKAGETSSVNRTIYQHTGIDPNLFVYGRRNIDRMRAGLAPYVVGKSGKLERVELHHLTSEEFDHGSVFFTGQKRDGSLVELPTSLHRGEKYNKVLHGLNIGMSFRKNFDFEKGEDGKLKKHLVKSDGAKHYQSFRRQYWKLRAAQFSDV